MQLVLSLADEDETMQSLCSDPSTGCQSEFGLNTNFSPCAIVAEIHLLPTCLISSLSLSLAALCVPETLHGPVNVIAQQVWKACLVVHRTSDLEFHPKTSMRCTELFLLQIKSENISPQKASVLRTFTVRPVSFLRI